MPSVQALLHLPPCLLGLIFAYIAPTANTYVSPTTSPKASTDLVCHTTDPAECYPAIFSPTKDFAVVHEDQSVPPGLHIRINLATGLKEARLNIPEESDDNEAAVIVVDNDPAHNYPDQGSAERPGPDKLVEQNEQLVFDSFDRNGDVHSGLATKTEFDTASSRIIKGSQSNDAIVEDLGVLTDLAHDVELGLAIAQNRRLSLILLQYIDESNRKTSVHVRSTAALLLGTALQNNDEALKALLVSCHPEKHAVYSVRNALEDVARLGESGAMPHDDFTFASRLIFLLSQVCRNGDQLNAFVAENGMVSFNQLLSAKADSGSEEAKAKIKIKIANFVVDFALNMSKSPKSHATLIDLCDQFRIDPLARYSTDSAAFISALSAFQALQAIFGDECA